MNTFKKAAVFSLGMMPSLFFLIYFFILWHYGDTVLPGWLFPLGLFFFILQLIFATKLVWWWEKSARVIYQEEEESLMRLFARFESRDVQQQISSLLNNIKGVQKNEIWLMRAETDTFLSFELLEQIAGEWTPVKGATMTISKSGIFYDDMLKRNMLLPKSHYPAPFHTVIVFPLRDSENDIVGLWVIYHQRPENIDISERAGMMLVFIQHILEYELRLRIYRAEMETAIARSSNPSYHDSFQSAQAGKTFHLLATILHEIRTPVAKINNFITLLSHHSEQIRKDAARNIHLVMEELSEKIAKIEMYKTIVSAPSTTGKHTLLIDSLRFAHSFAQKMKEKTRVPVYFSFNDSNGQMNRNFVNVRVAGSPELLAIALRELIENACLHTAGGQVNVFAGLQKLTGGAEYAVIAIVNSGHIPPETLEKITRFGNASDFMLHTQEGSGRLGMGLFLVYSAISQMGGSLNIQNGENNRVIVVLRLPVVKT